ncbi:MAG: aminotransferase, partial [Eubacterium sp.]|nr:aminotransferase [Eubacterium sp.]
LKPAAKDFRIFWDNAYALHHFYPDIDIDMPNILEECEKAGNPDMVYQFASTSKITFPGAGIAAMSASENNIKEIKSRLSWQTIGYDKINQLRHVKFFKNVQGLLDHLKLHAEIIRPKFETTLGLLDQELSGLGIASWTKPVGGYFISFDSMEGCARKIVAKCKEAGVITTGAGATYPYGLDPKDSNIRIAPTYPPLSEIATAIRLFITCVKLVSVEKLLEE